MEEGILDEGMESQRLELGPHARMHLTSVAKWSKFFAIVGFIIGGMVLLGAIFAGTLIGSFSGLAGSELGGSGAGVGIGVSIFYSLFSLIYFVPSYFAYKFSSETRLALANEDSYTLTSALNYHKNTYLFWGIVAIIGLAFYGLALLMVLVVGVGQF